MKLPIYSILKRFGLVLSIIGLVHCGSDFTVDTGDDSDPNLNDPTIAVVAEVGAPNQVILTDARTYSRHLADNIENYITDNLPGSGDDFGIFRVREVVSEVPEDGFSAEVEVTESAQGCTGGGTKQLAGVLDLQVLAGADQGTLSGTYNVIYSDCVEIVRLETATGACNVETLLSGTVQNDINITFNDLQEFDNDVYVIDDAITATGFGFAIENGGTQSVDYSYTLTINSRVTDPDENGSLEFQGQNFDVTEISGFVASASASSICP